MLIAVTGHRPNKLNNEYDGSGPLSQKISNALQGIINTYKPSGLMSGMALGVDMLWAELAIKNNLDLIAAIPCANQESVWPKSSQDRYNAILSYPKCKRHVLNVTFTAGCMQERNIWMVDKCDLLTAVWDGSSGGTGNCVKYAKKVKRQIIRINPMEL